MSDPRELSNWFVVKFDEEKVELHVNPPGSEKQEPRIFFWNDVIRVCFQANDFLISDEVYVFTSKRPESYVVPMQASGADKLWGEIIERELFDAKLAIKAATEGEGLYCWPEITREEIEKYKEK
ncbi:MAG: hypothetical protein ACFFCS_15105 [Candidatus Hodarchaeota archaeon]